MFKSILAWFEGDDSKQEQESPQPEKAAAALLVEVAMADHELTNDESAALAPLLMQHTGITQDEAHSLIEAAHEEVDAATSLHQFTRYLNEHFTIDQKCDLVTTLWKVALSDNQIDPLEESMIRKIADLLHLRHSEYMQSKHAAQGKL
ncbi:TerB family tellurite resistance protein [Bermanella marisrubri]|uniref:Co-chaperone DjlA N-terminal domain-containing protein n=1 Tax=Bermanella marisrubri TaxID=207949 RepID=Q1N4I5_9GAMM|nr:TerB family tellurite resistance protein [Bermanella marisrubri]EAT13443.1 hypothetical protein RED65_01745 [Oceanobacter sp. RED65] [Bermanella marisrubri]QIZ84190.1 TerB family tellurite resistance protein [Bermanella marisrubri]